MLDFNEGDMRAARLARRYSLLSAAGRLPAPDGAEATVIVRMTNPGWSAACIGLLLKYSAPDVNIVAVPGRYGLPPLPPQFEAEPRLALMPFAAGADLLGKAMRESGTPFIAVMEDRVMVTPDWLPRLLWPFYDEEAVMASGPYQAPEPGEDGEARAFGSLRELLNSLPGEAARREGEWRRVPLLAGSCIVFRSSVLKETGGWDCSLQGWQAQTADWCLRIRSLGGAVAGCRDVLLHELHAVDSAGEAGGQEFAAVCAKWGVDAGADPLLQLHKLDPAAALASLPPAGAASRVPQLFDAPLVTVIVYLYDDGAAAGWLRLRERLTYGRIHWIAVAPAGMLTACPAEPVHGEADYVLLSGRAPAEDESGEAWGHLCGALAAARAMAQGDYVAYADPHADYPPSYLEQAVDLLFRSAADVTEAPELPKLPELPDGTRGTGGSGRPPEAGAAADRKAASPPEAGASAAGGMAGQPKAGAAADVTAASPPEAGASAAGGMAGQPEAGAAADGTAASPPEAGAAELGGMVGQAAACPAPAECVPALRRSPLFRTVQRRSADTGIKLSRTAFGPSFAAEAGECRIVRWEYFAGEAQRPATMAARGQGR